MFMRFLNKLLAYLFQKQTAKLSRLECSVPRRGTGRPRWPPASPSRLSRTRCFVSILTSLRRFYQIVSWPQDEWRAVINGLVSRRASGAAKVLITASWLAPLTFLMIGCAELSQLNKHQLTSNNILSQSIFSTKLPHLPGTLVPNT